MFAVPVPPPRLDDVGVERALHEELRRLALGRGLEHERLGGALEAADELAPDDLALLLGVGDAGERVEELLLGVDRDEADARRGDVVLLDLATLVGAQQAVVDEDADELVADRLVHDRGRDGRVDAAGEAADHARRADLLADAGDLLGDDVAAVPVGGDAGGAVQEVLEHGLAERRVLDLGVPLHAVELAGVARERGDGRRRRSTRARRSPRAPSRRSRRGSSTSSARSAGPTSRVLSPAARVTSVAPYSRWPVRATSPPSALAMAWKP